MELIREPVGAALTEARRRLLHDLSSRSAKRGRRSRQDFVLASALALALAGVVLVGQAGYIHVKAVLAQILLERAFAHKRTAPIETDTPGYTMVNASLDWHPLSANPELSMSLAANNIFDVEARRSTSQLKDYAPLAGRDIRLTARLDF